MKYKYALLILNKLKLVKFQTKDELNQLISDLEETKRPYQVLKNHGDVWSIMECYI